MRKTVFVITFLFAASVLIAAPMKPHNDAKGKFKVSYPGNWTKDASAENLNVNFVSPDEHASIGIRMDELPPNLSAQDFLVEIEKNMESKNIMSHKDGALDKDALKQTNSDDGIMGVFLTGTGEEQVRQIMIVLKKKERFYTLIITFLEVEKESYRQLMKDVLNSFRINS